MGEAFPGPSGGVDSAGYGAAPGVSSRLARARGEVISEPAYRLGFEIEPGRRTRGRIEISFILKEVAGPLVIDFAGDSVLSVRGKNVEPSWRFSDEHIVVRAGSLERGFNSLEIEFVPGGGPLHGGESYVYSLFVPDRARFAFPCFDQPDLKARFSLTLEIPAAWEAVSNALVHDETTEGGRRRVVFSETPPLSTYFFSFAAGDFGIEESVRDGRRMRLYHMEPDSAKVARNAAVIFDLHAAALRWMEEYTGMPYPFPKFDFVLVPSFTYSGMEHPGAVLYRAERLLLEETATEMDRLRRASVISHETAHMWFGDLVTMAWFDDVWLKEAFAQFMADRIVRPSFPGVGHRLLFIASHYGPLYDIERTAGTHPVRQELDNMERAGTLYGDIVYHKPPVMLDQLEVVMGAEELREGLGRYLEAFAFGNARWEDLVGILDPLTDIDLAQWSRVWVMEKGRPEVTVRPDDAGRGFVVRQEDPLGRGIYWPQRIDLVFRHQEKNQAVPVEFRGPELRLDYPDAGDADFILPDGYGMGFGYFGLDSASLSSLREAPPRFEDPVMRAVYVLLLRDNFLGGEFDDPLLYIRCLEAQLAMETVEINLQSVLDNIVEAFRCFAPAEELPGIAEKLERELLDKLASSGAASAKSACFKAYRSIVSSADGIEYMRRLWSDEREIEGLEFTERDYCTMALELAARGVNGWETILDTQAGRMKDGELKRRFEFVRRAASYDVRERDGIYADLREADNRRREPWVIEALYYLHHPSRRRQSVRYIRPGLELLEEVRRTGDIFFPGDWVEATLAYHNSEEAVEAVRDFIDTHPGGPGGLRLKILQHAYKLFRAGGRMDLYGSYFE